MIHTTLLGGAFGRRQETDFVKEAVEVSAAIGAPVRVVWTRGDDFTHDFYRPSSYHRISAALGPDGLPVAWRHAICAPSIWRRVIPQFADTILPGSLPWPLRKPAAAVVAAVLKRLPDPNITVGAVGLPYAIPNVEVEFAEDESEAPVGFWRSVGDSYNAFVVETFLDELARAADYDPYHYRRVLLRNSPRHLRVLDAVASAAAWEGSQAGATEWRGLAVRQANGTVVAQVSDLSLSDRAGPKVKLIVCAVDCGRIVDRRNVEAQVEGGIAMGLSATLRERITVNNGSVQQADFRDYPILGLRDMPSIEVHLVDSDAPPSGIGEPPIPPVAAAIANAVFAATGTPVRRLPLMIPEIDG
jgi:CO/xanthine dehydrogenase Mo-binding subunit